MLITDAGAPLRSSDPLYFMLRPEPRAARQMQRVGSQLRAENKLAGRLVEETRLHVTLLFLCRFGQLTREAFAAIRKTAAMIAMPAFLAGFDWAVSFGNGSNRPLVLRGYDTVAGVMLLRRELVAALKPIGLRSVTENYTPHVTLLRETERIDDRPIEEIRWPAREFALIRSYYGQSRHEVLGRWPLHG
jgi:RNA 2',3'-cyclic 3'-phosphodiesterase